MSREVTFTPIGHVRGERKEATKTALGDNRSRIELDGARFKPDALLGIEEALSYRSDLLFPCPCR